MQKQQQKKPVYNPFESFENKNRHSKTPSVPEFKGIPQTAEGIKGADNFSPMDLEKLNKAYAGQDEKSLEDIRKNLTPEQIKEQEKVRFFKDYKRKEEEYFLKRKQEEQEKKRQEAIEEQQTLQRLEQERQAKQGGDLPQGKVRKNIFGGNKTKTNMRIPPPSTVEYKPSRGAQ